MPKDQWARDRAKEVGRKALSSGNCFLPEKTKNPKRRKKKIKTVASGEIEYNGSTPEQSTIRYLPEGMIGTPEWPGFSH